MQRWSPNGALPVAEYSTPGAGADEERKQRAMFFCCLALFAGFRDDARTGGTGKHENTARSLGIFQTHRSNDKHVVLVWKMVRLSWMNAFLELLSFMSRQGQPVLA